MNASAVYDAEVRHHRRAPAHTVRQRLRLAYLDLDELPGAIDGPRGWSTRPAPVWFRRRDYLDGTDRPIREALADLVEARGADRPVGPVRMLTQLRTLGWLFNPLTTYYCFDPDGRRLVTVVLEITNTPWHERFWYVLDADQVTHDPVPFPKAFHVSPFLPMDLSYRCRAAPPDERLALHIELYQAAAGGDPVPVLDVSLTGRRQALGPPVGLPARIGAATQTIRVSAAIYAHALVLRSRGATFHRHPPTHRQPARPCDRPADGPTTEPAGRKP